jgi:hypothetical protein
MWDFTTVQIISIRNALKMMGVNIFPLFSLCGVFIVEEGDY